MYTGARVGLGVGVNPGGKPLLARTWVATGVGGSVGRVAVGDDRGGPAQGLIVAVGLGPMATSVGAGGVGTTVEVVLKKWCAPPIMIKSMTMIPIRKFFHRWAVTKGNFKSWSEDYII